MLDLLKREQDRLTSAIAAAEGRLAAIAADFKTAETNLHRALDRAGDCQAAYREASDRMRRQFNLAFFKRLVIHDEGVVSGELAEPSDVILGEELRRAATVREAEGLAEAIDQAERKKKQRPPGPGLALAGAVAAAPAWGDGWSPKILVRLSGALSNPQACPRLGAAARACAEVGKRNSSSVPKRPVLRLPLGAIQDAVIAVLVEADEPLPPRKVHELVERRFGRPVSQDTVGSFLSVAARRASMPIKRVGRSLYVAEGC
jgi:hypothetical protein